MTDPVPSKDLLYAAKTKVEEIKATLLDMRAFGLRGDLPSDEALYLLDEIESARRTAEYWKAEHLAGNAEIDRLQRELARVTGEREPPHCSTCACGLAAEPPAVPVAWLRRFRDGTYDVFHDRPRNSDVSDRKPWHVVPLYERSVPPAETAPTAWMRGHRSYSPGEPDDYDVECVYGDDPPDDSGKWIPLYRRVAQPPEVEHEKSYCMSPEDITENAQPDDETSQQPGTGQ